MFHSKGVFKMCHRILKSLTTKRKLIHKLLISIKDRKNINNKIKCESEKLLNLVLVNYVNDFNFNELIVNQIIIDNLTISLNYILLILNNSF